jgi:hypothetical protein
MKNALKHISFLLFALSLILILADSNFIGEAFSQHHIDSETACSDFTSQGDNSNSVCFEDILFMSDSKVILSNFSNHVLLFITSKSNFLHSFSTSIWQPPKRA